MLQMVIVMVRQQLEIFLIKDGQVMKMEVIFIIVRNIVVFILREQLA